MRDEEEYNLDVRILNAIREISKDRVKIPTRERACQDYCGATFHASLRNFGRKPKYKDKRANAAIKIKLQQSFLNSRTSYEC